MTPQTNLVLATGLAKPVKQNGVYSSPKEAESDDQAFANILDENSQVQSGASNGPRLRSTPSLGALTKRALSTDEDAANADDAGGSGALKTAERAQKALYVSSGAALTAAIAFPVTATAAKASTAASGSDVIAEQDLPDTGARGLKTRRAHPYRAAASISAPQKSSPPPAPAADGAATPASGQAASYLPLSFSSGEAQSSADPVDVGVSTPDAAPLGSSAAAYYQSAKLMAGSQDRKSETTAASADTIDKKALASTRLTSSQKLFAPDPTSGMTRSGAAFAFQLATAAPITGLNQPSTPAAGKSAAANPAAAETSQYELDAPDSGTAANKHKPEPVTMPAGSSLADGISKASPFQEKSASAPLNANEPTGAGDAALLTNEGNALFSTASTAEKTYGAMETTAAAAASLKTQPGNAAKDPANSEKALRQSEVSSAPSGADPIVQSDNTTYEAATRPSQAEASRSHFERGGAFQGSNSQGSGSNGEASRTASTAPDAAFGVSQASSAALAMGAAVTGTASPSQQVFDAIRETAPAASGSSTTASDVQPSSEQPLKVITLALSPANLGTVSIELSLKGDQLGVKVQAEAGAAKLLSQDDGALEKLLKSAGYSLQGISVQIVSHSSQPSETTQAPLNQNSASTSTSTGENTGQKQQQRFDGQRAEGRQDRGQGYGHNQELGRGGSLYV